MKYKLMLVAVILCGVVSGIHAFTTEGRIKDADLALKELKKDLFAYKQDVRNYGSFFNTYIEVKMLIHSVEGEELDENELRSKELKDFPRLGEQRIDTSAYKKAIRVAERKFNEMVDALNELEKRLLSSQWETKEQALEEVEKSLFEEIVPVPSGEKGQKLTNKQKKFFKKRKGTPLARPVTEEGESDIE